MENKVRVAAADGRYVTRGFLEIQVWISKGCALAAALSGAEQAAFCCMAHPVGLVIMNVMMKDGLDGLTCAKAIHRNNPGEKIILTATMTETRWIGEARETGIGSFRFRKYPGIRLAEVMDRTMAGERVFRTFCPARISGTRPRPTCRSGSCPAA